MAKIIKVGSQNLTPNKIANPFKTSRNSTTNPFKYNNFDGTTLPFELTADVFETKKSSKLRMIASSATGSMNKIKSGVRESISNFVNRVRERYISAKEGISSAWNYATSTTFTGAMSDAATAIRETSAYKQANDILFTPIHIPVIDKMSERVTAMKGGISSKVEIATANVVDLGKSMADKWTNMISKVKPNKISAETPVCELRQMWLNEIELEGAAA